MHELSIALSIIEGVEEELATRGAVSAAVVHLRLGPLSGVVKEALLFSYDLACEGTRLSGSKLEITELPVIIYCVRCQMEQPVISFQNLCCAACRTPSGNIRGGSELEVFALELADECTTAVG